MVRCAASKECMKLGAKAEVMLLARISDVSSRTAVTLIAADLTRTRRSVCLVYSWYTSIPVAGLNQCMGPRLPSSLPTSLRYFIPLEVAGITTSRALNKCLPKYLRASMSTFCPNSGRLSSNHRSEEHTSELQSRFDL